MYQWGAQRLSAFIHGPRGAHVGDKYNLVFLRIRQWSRSCEKIGQREWGAQAQSIKALRGVSLVLLRAVRHTDEAWSCVTQRQSEREVEGGTCRFHSYNDGGCIIQIFCYIFFGVILGEGKSRSESFNPYMWIFRKAVNNGMLELLICFLIPLMTKPPNCKVSSRFQAIFISENTHMASLVCRREKKHGRIMGEAGKRANL